MNGGNVSQKFRGLSHNYVFGLVLITLAITSYVLSVQIRIGVPYWDVFNFLNNAWYFAGGGGTAGTIFLPPLLPILTSLFFRWGLVSSGVIFALGAVIFVTGVLGLYYLFKIRFSEVQSFAGSLIFLSLAVLMPWSASGGIDLPAVSISIWAVYFLVKGMEGQDKLLYLVVPMLALAVLTRYTAGLLAVPLILYYLMKGYSFRTLKGISVGFLATIILASPLVWYFYTKMGNFDMIYTLLLVTATTSPAAVDDVAYNPNLLFYLQNLPNYISLAPLQGSYAQLLNPSRGHPSVLAYFMIIISGAGILMYIYRGLKFRIGDLEINKTGIFKIGFFGFLTITFFLTFNHTSYLVSVAIVFLLCYLAYNLLRGRSSKYGAMDFMFLSWFLSYLIFHSILPIKVDRYFITMAPALAYFLLLGLSELLGGLKLKKPSLNSKWIYLAISIVLLISTAATFAGHTPKKVFVLYIEDAGDWIVQQDPQYMDKVIFSDYSSALSWYLKKEVKGGFPRFFKTPSEFAQFLKSQKADYYVDSLGDPKPDLPGYHPVKTFQMVTIYQKD
ncbi:MAG: hypothetical protein BME94_08045 [Methanobacteriales archaeon Met13]